MNSAAPCASRVTPADDPTGTPKIITIVRDEVPLKEKLANAELLVTRRRWDRS